MRISFALPAMNLSGGTRVVFDYANYLISQGHEVTVVVPATRVASFKDRARAFLKRQSIEHEPNEVAAHFSWTRVPVLRGRSSEILTEHDFPDADLVVATWWETGEWIAVLPNTKGRKIHFVQDHEVFPYTPFDRVRAVYAQMWPKITVSRWLSDICTAEYRAEAVYCVPNGVALDQFRGKPRIRGDSLVAGMLWSSSERKNSEMGLDALKITKSLFPDLKVSMFGSSQPPSNVSNLNWINYDWRPNQADIPQIYAKCDVWLFSSRTEGFGLPILEAMAMHTPVVATQAGAASDLIDRKNGLLVDCAASSMSIGLAKILQEEPDAWALRSQAARATAELNSLQFSAKRFEEVLLNLAS